MEKTCDGIDCGASADCSEGNVGDGFKCVCKKQYWAAEAYNGDRLVCVLRTCENLGHDLRSCGVNTECTDLDAGQGVLCECASDAFSGTAVANNEAMTDCTEKTCDGVSCGPGAMCVEGSTNDGYACMCESSHIGTTKWNLSLIHI